MRGFSLRLAVLATIPIAGAAFANHGIEWSGAGWYLWGEERAEYGYVARLAGPFSERDCQFSRVDFEVGDEEDGTRQYDFYCQYEAAGPA